jgi:hypothetical protein
MHTPLRTLALSLATAVLSAAVLAACDAVGTTSPGATRAMPAPSLQRATSYSALDQARVVAALKRATDRYHDIAVARSEGFVLLHDCESRPGEGPVGTVYVNMARMLDGKILPELPDALIYEPQREGRLRLVGAEFAIPYALAPGQQPPTLLGATFQDEPEFGVFALHAWIWRENPSGLFAETNPRVSCLTN